jgi:hypothetical protein
MRIPGRPPDDGEPKIVILPWLSLKQPTKFERVQILPRSDAIERARSFAGRDLSEHVKYATSYFGSGSRYSRVRSTSRKRR